MSVLKEMYQRGKAMQGQEKAVVSGIEFHRVGSTFAEGGQAILYKAVSMGDTSREFLIKEFKGTEVSERLLSAEKLSQLAATNSHQSILASLFFQKETMRSVMLKAPSDTETLQETFHRLEKDPPQKEGSNCPRLELAIAITKSLLGALASIHKQGILHLDLSPCNVLYARPSVSGLAGTVYLIDFNSAAESGTVVDANQKSTLAFSSPEAREVGAVLSPCADLYSVGGLLLLLAVGEKASNSPRNAERWSIPELPGIRNGNVRRPINNSPHIPAVYKELLCNIIVKSTTYAKDRYQSAAEMLADLCQLEDIIAGNGFHREVILDNSKKLLQRLFDESQLDPDLFEDIVPVDPQAPTFDDACTNEDILLLSPGGTGKTTALHRTWQKFLNGGPVPIFVDLAAFHGGENYIHDEILKNYVASHDPIETQRLALDRLFANEQFILMLDGYNEAENPGALDLEICGLAAKSGISAILASRYLPEHSFASWQRYTMEPLSDDIIEKKLAQSEKIVTIPSLRRFLNRPMYLSAFTRLPRSAVLPSTPGSILLESIRDLKNRTIGHNEEYRLRDLAVEEILPRVSQSNAMLVSYSHMTQALEACKHTERFQRVPQDLRSAHHVIDSLCHMGILKRVDEEKYQYAHQNYRDLFAGLHLAKLLEAGRCPEQLFRQPIAPDLAGFIADMLCDATTVLPKVLSSFKGKRDPEAQQAVFNLIRILKIATHKRLSGICFDGLDLTMVDLQGIDISICSFAAAIIPATAVLRRGHVESVSHIFHIPGKKLILTYSSSEKRIFVWDENGNPVKTFSLTIGSKSCGEIAVAVSQDYVALFNRYELEVRQIPSGTLVRKMFLPEQPDLKSLPMEHLEKAGMQMDFAYKFANPLAFVGKKKLALRIDAYMVSLDVVTGKIKPYVLGQTDDPVRAVAVSKGGVFMAGSKTVYNLNPLLATERYRFDTEHSHSKLHISPNGRFLAVENDYSYELYDLSHDPKLLEEGRDQVFVSDTHLAHWHLRDGVVIKNIKTGEALPKPELKDVTCACLSKDKLFAASLNNELFVVDLKTGTHQRHALGIRSEAYHDTRYIGLRGAMWSEAQRSYLPIVLNDGTVAKQIPGCCTAIHQAEGFPMTLPVAKEKYYSRFQEAFYIVARKRYRLEVYSLKTGQLVTMARGLWDWCRAKPTPLQRPCLHYIQASYIPRHKKLLAVTADGIARLWDESKETWLTLGTEPVQIRDAKAYPWGESEPGLCVVADSLILAVHTDGKLRAWDLDGQCVFSEAVDDVLKLAPYQNTCLVISGSVAGEDCRFRVFDTVKGAFSEDSFQGAVSSRLTPHSIIVMGSLEVEPEYRGDISMNEDLEIAFGGDSYLIYLSDPASGMVAGDRVVFWDQDELRLYDRITGSRLKQIPWSIITQEKGTVLDRKLSPDGSKFAFSFRNGNVYVLDLETEEIQKYHSITPASVAGADFRGATFLGDEKVKRILAEHGAITD